jgi:hypothetical protein
MPTSYRSTITLIAAAFVLSCSDQPTNPSIDGPQLRVTDAALGSAGAPGDGMVTVPFKARFYTEASSVVEDECGPGIQLNTQEGKGNATHLGTMTTKMVFCFDLNEGPDFGTYYFLEGEENGYFSAANGDQLWITVTEGQVIFDPAVGPDYAAYFQDPFSFTGGTGRFEGATGGGMIDSKLRADLIRTDHHWTGELTLMRR